MTLCIVYPKFPLIHFKIWKNFSKYFLSFLKMYLGFSKKIKQRFSQHFLKYFIKIVLSAKLILLKFFISFILINYFYSNVTCSLPKISLNLFQNLKKFLQVDIS